MRAYLSLSVVLPILMGLLVMGCTDEMLIQNNSAENIHSVSGTLQQVLINAESFFAETGNATRSSRQISSIEPIASKEREQVKRIHYCI